MKMHTQLIWLAGLVCSFDAACANSPRSGQKLGANNELVTFNGVYPQSGVELQFTIQNRSANQYVAFAAAVTGEPSYTDATGQIWYSYSTTSRIPSDDAYWLPHSDNSL